MSGKRIFDSSVAFQLYTIAQTVDKHTCNVRSLFIVLSLFLDQGCQNHGLRKSKSIYGSLNLRMETFQYHLPETFDHHAYYCSFRDGFGNLISVRKEVSLQCGR